MILTTHALVGAALGKQIHNPFLLILILIPLHYLLDVFRHGEYLNKKSTFRDTTWKVVLDLTIALGTILASTFWLHVDRATLFFILLGAFISMFPDPLTVLYWKLNWKFLGKIYQFHQFVHHRFPDGAPEREWTLRNAANDIIFSAIAIALLLF